MFTTFFLHPPSTFSPLFPPLCPLPSPPTVFLSFNGLTAATGFERGSLPAFHRDQGVSVFWINEIRSFNPGHPRGWRNKDITSGCASVAVKHGDIVIYPIAFCIGLFSLNFAHLSESQFDKA